jgi:hypothetical protein
MEIRLKKFGDLLTSRQDGREALAAIGPLLQNLSENEEIKLDFEGVITFTPSWADEFITGLVMRFDNRISFINDENPSVKATLELLKKLSLNKPE